MKFNIVEEWALAKDDRCQLCKSVTIGYRVDEFDDNFNPPYCRLSVTFKTRDEANRFVETSIRSKQ